MPFKRPSARHLRRLSKPWGAVRLDDLRKHAVWAVDLERKDEGLWVCPLVGDPPLTGLFLDWFSPVFVMAVFELADGTYPRGLICPSQDADAMELDPAVFGVDGSLVRLVVSEYDGGAIERACERLGRSIGQVMPMRFAAVVECGRGVVREGRLPGFPIMVRDRRVVLWMQDGVRYHGPG